MDTPGLIKSARQARINPPEAGRNTSGCAEVAPLTELTAGQRMRQEQVVPITEVRQM